MILNRKIFYLIINKTPVLADYNITKFYNDINNKGTHTGEIATETYRAPEILTENGYGFGVDIWSLGITFYEMYTRLSKEDEIYKKICINKNNKYDYDKNMIKFLSDEFHKFKKTKLGYMILRMLEINPKYRITAEQLVEYDFIKGTKNKKEIVSKTKEIEISKEIYDEYYMIELDIQKKITLYAAQTYYEKTNCSARAAVELAHKFYETEIKISDSEDYVEEELQIFKDMNYNLFV